MTTYVRQRIRSMGGLAVTALALVACFGLVSVADAAKVPKNSVGSKQIKKNAVKTKHLKNGAVSTDKIKDLAVTTDKIADAAVTTAKIADAAVTTEKIADAAVTTVKIADAAVATGKIAVDAVGSAEIAPSAVRADELAGTQLATNVANIAANGATNVSVQCPAGTQVLSGGGTTSSFGVHMVSSFQQGNGWVVAYQNTTAAAQTITAIATCLQG